MITIGTAVLIGIALLALWRGRPMVAGLVACIALASTSSGATAIASSKTVATQLGTTGQSVLAAFIK